MWLANTVYAAMILGGNWGFEEKEVSVAGHTVKRTPVCNAAWQIGLFNEGRAGTGQSNLVSESMMERFQTTSPVLPEIWYNTKQLVRAQALGGQLVRILADLLQSEALPEGLAEYVQHQIVESVEAAVHVRPPERPGPAHHPHYFHPQQHPRPGLLRPGRRPAHRQVPVPARPSLNRPICQAALHTGVRFTV